MGVAVGATSVTGVLAAESDKPKPATSAAEPDGLEVLLLPIRITSADDTLLKDSVSLRKHRATLNALLMDTAQDLGLVVDLSGAELRQRPAKEHVLRDLAEQHGKLVIAPELRIKKKAGKSRALELRIVAATPGSKVLRSRVERISGDDLSVRAVVMLRDIVRGASSSPSPTPRRPELSSSELAAPARSMGRVILATNATLFGGFVGYSLQRSSQSDDPRLLYPLLAVGAGVGLGSAVIIADEWDVGVGDAWYLAAGAWWPAVAGHLIYERRFGGTPSASDDEPWSFGLIASATGLTLSTVGLLARGMGDGGAAMAHSGGALGVVIGGLTEFAITGVSDEVPFAGMGYGAAAGWMVAAAAAVNLHPDVSRMLTIDLGFLLGGLAGASAASPLLFGETTPTKTRGWVAAAGGGLLLGGGLAWFFTRPSAPDEPKPDKSKQAEIAWPRYLMPQPGPVGLVLDGLPPAWGLSWSGPLP